MIHYKGQLIACDFFTVETLTLTTLYGVAGLTWTKRK
jgi:hypothetical protein